MLFKLEVWFFVTPETNPVFYWDAVDQLITQEKTGGEYDAIAKRLPSQQPSGKHHSIMERFCCTNMESALDIIEKELEEAGKMSSICTSEWCEATEHIIDELSNSLFSISEPRWASQEDSKKIKELRRKTQDIYSKYKNISKN